MQTCYRIWDVGVMQVAGVEHVCCIIEASRFKADFVWNMPWAAIVGSTTVVVPMLWKCEADEMCPLNAGHLSLI